MNCGAENDTTVSAHSNHAKHGKGMSIKAHDCFIAWLCFDCHSWLDQGKGWDPTRSYFCRAGDKEEMFQRAHDRTMLEMFKAGILEVK